jgi:hypothetical protein
MNDFTKLNELAEKLKDFYKTPEGELYILKVRKKFEIYNNRKKRLWGYLESLSNDAFEELVQKFIKWENDFEEQENEKHRIKSSNLFNIIVDTIFLYTPPCEDETMFFGGGSTYRGYQLKVFVGQGSFYTIEKNDERIFVST